MVVECVERHCAPHLTKMFISSVTNSTASVIVQARKMSNQFTYVKKVEEFVSFDYQSLYSGTEISDKVLNFFANPLVPILAVVLYLLLSNQICNWLRSTFKVQPKGFALQWIVIIHSAILAVYSGWTFVNTVKIFVPYTYTNGWYASVCDVNGDLWYNQNLGFWVTLFYLSKYYEFIDTW